MPHKTINSFPSLKDEVELPFFLRAVGTNEYQQNDTKKDGYLYHQLFLVEEGSLALTADGTRHVVSKGGGFFINKGLPFSIEKLQNKCTTHFVFFGCNCEEILFNKIHFLPVSVFDNINIDEMKLLCKKMYLLSTEDNFYSRCLNSALVYEFIMNVFASNEKKDLVETNDMNPALLLAKRYIEQYYFTDLTLDTLAEFAHVSPQHLCRLFKKHMNMRPTHYINLTRIKVAKWRLHNTDMTITEIAEEVGFSTPYYFTNTFKKYEHMSPSTYRKMVKESDNPT